MKTIGTVNPATRNETILNMGIEHTPGVPPAFLTPRIRVTFTSMTTTVTPMPTSSLYDGLQAAHFVTHDGTNPRMGVGDFQTIFIANNNNPLADPQNTLEILPSFSSPYWTYASGNGSSTSGLRLRDLTSASTTVPNGVSTYTYVSGTGTNTMVATSTVTVNNLKLMTVDNNGDVVLTDAPGTGTVTATTLGNPCSSPIKNPIPSTWEIPLNGAYFLFTDYNSTNSRVGIGDFSTPTYSCSPQAKLHVIGSVGETNTELYVQNLYASNNFRANVSLINDAGSRATFSKLSSVSAPSNGLQITNDGNMFLGTNATGSIDLFTASSLFSVNLGGGQSAFLAGNPVSAAAHGNLWVDAPAVAVTPEVRIVKQGVGGNSGGKDDVALLGSGTGFNTNTQVNGLMYLYQSGPALTNSVTVAFQGWPTANSYINTGGNVGINMTNPAYALDVNGQIRATGFGPVSDQRYKINITPLDSALYKVTHLNGKHFYFDTITYPNKKFPSQKQIGLIAQQVKPIVPEVIYADSAGIQMLDYDKLSALFVEAFKEQQNHIKQQDSIIAHQGSVIQNLVSTVNSCCSTNVSSRTTTGGGNKTVNNIDVELSDIDAIVLNTAVPNPFAEQTTITYNVPEKYNAAQILFYDNNGRMIKTVDITKKGKGQLNVYANDLTNGVYSYTLIVDGKIIDTKRMVKQN